LVTPIDLDTAVLTTKALNLHDSQPTTSRHHLGSSFVKSNWP
jgi:hypothetical protein